MHFFIVLCRSCKKELLMGLINRRVGGDLRKTQLSIWLRTLLQAGLVCNWFSHGGRTNRKDVRRGNLSIVLPWGINQFEDSHLSMARIQFIDHDTQTGSRSILSTWVGWELTMDIFHAFNSEILWKYLIWVIHYLNKSFFNLSIRYNELWSENISAEPKEEISDSIP